MGGGFFFSFFLVGKKVKKSKDKPPLHPPKKRGRERERGGGCGEMVYTHIYIVYTHCYMLCIFLLFTTWNRETMKKGQEFLWVERKKRGKGKRGGEVVEGWGERGGHGVCWRISPSPLSPWIWRRGDNISRLSQPTTYNLRSTSFSTSPVPAAPPISGVKTFPSSRFASTAL